MAREPSKFVNIVAHDPAWANAFREEDSALREAAGAALVRLHHIGSTSVPGLAAKPIIDLLGEARSLKAIETVTPDIEALGYEALGAFGLPGRRYFRKCAEDGHRTHHLHIYAEGDAELTRHLAFRDYLRANAEMRDAYGALKRQLTAEGPTEAEVYMDGKDAFVKRIEAEALDWLRRKASMGA